MSDEYFDEMFSKTPVMAILRGMGPERTLTLAHRAWDRGIASVEIPIQNPEDLESLKAAVSAGRQRGFPVGAGTIVALEHVAQAVECGAAFAVSPGTDRQIMAACRDAKLPQLPGVATASDIQAAISMGMHWVKAFPASVLGPAWLNAMRGPFPTMNFVATGGIDANNVDLFVNAGAKVVAVGSALEDPRQLELLTRYAGRQFDRPEQRLKDSTNAD
jgi:2-dehydro-3-deoxyphosphogluconate aldolase/(4S)-4-hydroxy-2-oxoglutarate aldolase